MSILCRKFCSKVAEQSRKLWASEQWYHLRFLSSRHGKIPLPLLHVCMISYWLFHKCGPREGKKYVCDLVRSLREYLLSWPSHLQQNLKSGWHVSKWHLSGGTNQLSKSLWIQDINQNSQTTDSPTSFNNRKLDILANFSNPTHRFEYVLVWPQMLIMKRW